MKLNPFTTRKVLKGLAVTSAFLAVSGVVTSSILGCIAFAHLQNLEIPKPIEASEAKEQEIDPQDVEQAKQLSGQNRTLIANLQEEVRTKAEKKDIKDLEEIITELKNDLQREVNNREELKTKLRKLEESKQTLEKELEALKDSANETLGRSTKNSNDLIDQKADIEEIKAKLNEWIELAKELKTAKEVRDVGTLGEYAQQQISALEVRILQIINELKEKLTKTVGPHF